MKKKTKKKIKDRDSIPFEVYGVVETGYVLNFNADNIGQAKLISGAMSVNQWLISGQMDARSVSVLWCREKVKEKKCRKQKQ